MNQNQQVPNTIPSQAQIQAALARANIPPAAVNTAVTSQWDNVDKLAQSKQPILGKTYAQRVGSDITSLPQEQSDTIKNSADEIQQGEQQQNEPGFGNYAKGSAKEALGVGEAGVGSAWNALKTILSPITEAPAPGIKETEDAIGNTKTAQDVAMSVPGDKVANLQSQAQALAAKHPEVAKFLEDTYNLATGLAVPDKAADVATDAVDNIKTRAINAPAEDITGQEPTSTKPKTGIQNPKQYFTPASTQAQSAAATLPKEQLGADINTMVTTAKNRLLDNNNPTPSKVMGHDIATKAIDSEEPTSIKSQMNTVGATKDATIEAIKDKPVDPEALKGVSSSINEDTEDIDTSDKGNKRLENFKNELHMLASGQVEATAGGQKIYIPGGKDYVPTVGDLDAFIDKWQKKPKFSDSDAQKAINTALGKINDHLKTVTDVHDNGIYRKANEDFFKLYDARDKARGILGSIDPNTNHYAGASSFNKAFSNADQPLAGLQKITGHNMAARAAIADAFDATVGASDKDDALKNVRASISPMMMGIRSGLNIIKTDLATPEALAAKLRAIAKIKKL